MAFGLGRLGVSFGTLGVLWALAAAGPPIVANQSMPFGALTRSAAGGAPLVNTGGTITGSTTNTLTGTNSSHFAISSAGVITPTASFVASPQASYTLTATVYNSAGSSSCTLTITTNALSYDTISEAEITAAATHAAATPTNDYTCYIRDGVAIGTFAVSINSLRGLSFSGTLTDPNEAVTYATKGTYNRAATPTMSGGSFHLTARTNYSPIIKGTLGLFGCKMIQVSRLTFANEATVDGYGYDGVTPGTANGNLLNWQLYIGCNPTYPTEPQVWIHHNRFGGYRTSTVVDRYIVSVYAPQAKKVIVEDNEFDGFYHGCSLAAVNYAAFRRNSMRRGISDQFRHFTNSQVVVMSFANSTSHNTDNVCFDFIDSDNWAAEHVDCAQYGSPNDFYPYVNCLVGWNTYYGAIQPLSKPGYSPVRSTQGVYTDDSPLNMDIGVFNNLGVVSAPFKMKSWTGTQIFENNTFAHDSTHNHPFAGASYLGVEVGSHILHDNLVRTINVQYGGTYNTGTDGTVAINSTQSSGTATSYYDTFAGPFSVGSYGPTWTVDQTDAATLKASLQAIFAVKPGGIAAGKGFEYNYGSPSASKLYWIGFP